MQKLNPSCQGAIEYVRLTDMSGRQAETLLDWLPQSYFTKVKSEACLMEDCIEYEDYEFWYEHCYQHKTDLYEEEL